MGSLCGSRPSFFVGCHCCIKSAAIHADIHRNHTLHSIKIYLFVNNMCQLANSSGHARGEWAATVGNTIAGRFRGFTGPSTAAVHIFSHFMLIPIGNALVWRTTGRNTRAIAVNRGAHMLIRRVRVEPTTDPTSFGSNCSFRRYRYRRRPRAKDTSAQWRTQRTA